MSVPWPKDLRETKGIHDRGLQKTQQTDNFEKRRNSVFERCINSPPTIAWKGLPGIPTWQYLMAIRYWPGAFGVYVNSYPSSSSLQLIGTLEGPWMETVKSPVPGQVVATRNLLGFPANIFTRKSIFRHISKEIEALFQVKRGHRLSNDRADVCRKRLEAKMTIWKSYKINRGPFFY